MDYNPPGSSVPGIFQTRILEWVAISFSRGSSWLWDGTYVSCIGRRVPLSHQGSLNSGLLNANAYIFPTAVAAKSLQSWPTLCDPTDISPPGSPAPGILQARTLEWVAISLYNAWKWKVKVKSLSRVRLLSTPWTAAYQAPPSMGFSRQEYWSGAPLPSLTTSWHLKAWTEREKTQKYSLLLLISTRTSLHETQRFLGFSHRCSKRTHDFGLLER